MSLNGWHQHEIDNLRGVGDRWDDLRFPVTSINPPGAVSDPDIDPDSGLLLFAASGTELIYTVAQMPHAWKEGSEIIPHVHWCKSTSAVGNVAWRLRYLLVDIGEVAGGWVDSGIADVPNVSDGDTAMLHALTQWPAIDMTGKTISCIINFEISRVGSDVLDTYGADARLAEFDLHYMVDSRGSRQEYIK